MTALIILQVIETFAWVGVLLGLLRCKRILDRIDKYY